MNNTNVTVINELKQKLANLKHTAGTLNPTKKRTSSKHTTPHSKNRGEKEEAAYAAPTPREQRGSITAEKNLHQWCMRRGLNINKIRIVATQLKRSSLPQSSR